jgi:hypothetical protein
MRWWEGEVVEDVIVVCVGGGLGGKGGGEEAVFGVAWWFTGFGRRLRGCRTEAGAPRRQRQRR